MSQWWLSEYFVDLETRRSRVRTIPRQGEILRESMHSFHVHFESWINFQKRVIFDKNYTRNISRTTARFQTRDHPLLRVRHYHLSYQSSVFTDWELVRSCVNIWLICNPWSISEQNFWHVQNSVVTFGQDFVVPQGMESGPITNFGQYNHQKLKTYKCIRFRRYCWRRQVVWRVFHVRTIHCLNPVCALI